MAPGVRPCRSRSRGGPALGSFSVRSRALRSRRRPLRCTAPRQHIFERAADRRDLIVEIAGERHAIPRDEERARSGGVYTVSGERAERLLARLIALRPADSHSQPRRRVRHHGRHPLDSASAATAFEACRTREPLPRAGWLEVWAQPERNQDERLHFSWWVASADAPLERLFDRGMNLRLRWSCQPATTSSRRAATARSSAGRSGWSRESTSA